MPRQLIKHFFCVSIRVFLKSRLTRQCTLINMDIIQSLGGLDRRTATMTATKGKGRAIFISLWAGTCIFFSPQITELQVLKPLVSKTYTSILSLPCHILRLSITLWALLILMTPDLEWNTPPASLVQLTINRILWDFSASIITWVNSHKKFSYTDF
jgi:hypothetical protein